jgi:hypothetical protein
MTDVVDAAKALRERPQEVATAVAQADPEPTKKKKKTTLQKKGMTTAQARASEHTGPDGEVAFGAPISGTPNPDNQNTDSNNP